MKIKQGDIFWIPVFEDNSAEIVHPHVIIQDDLINNSRVDTTVVCALSTKMSRISEPGNILLNAGEANLPQQSIIVVSQVSSIKKSQIGEYIGTLDKKRIEEIFNGMKFLQRLGER